jgi:hypothetical protein
MEMTTITERTAIIAEAEEQRAALMGAIAGLDDAALGEAAALGEWSVKDALLHLARWEEVTIGAIERHLEGGPDGESYEDYLAWNERWQREDASVTVTAAKAKSGETWGRLLRLLGSVPEARWDGDVVAQARGAVAEHYPEHVAAIRAWRGQ